MRTEADFEIHLPAVATVIQADRRGSEHFRGHQTENGVFVVDFEHIKDILDWHYYTTRQQLGRAGVKHLALFRQEWNPNTRLVGIPVTKHDLPIDNNLQVDLRMVTDPHDDDPSLPHRVVDTPVDFLVGKRNQDLMIKFEIPSRAKRLRETA